MLKFLHRSFLGEAQERFEKINDITMHEFTVLASVVVGLIILGIFPSVILNLVGGV
jgi:NADH:ubiquinone oxidoreductase subunit 4 (subunit M)